MRRESIGRQLAAVALLIVTLIGAWQMCGGLVAHRLGLPCPDCIRVASEIEYTIIG